MNQIYRVEINNVDVTDNVSDLQISKTVNRFYNVITFTLSNEFNTASYLNKNVDVYYGDNIVSGFIYSLKKKTYNSISINVRTYGAKLSEPFSPNMVTVDDATTASELCALYGNDLGHTINYNTVDLDFGGSYERDGTKLTALTRITNTIGGEYYDTNSGIVIEADKTIGDSYDLEINDEEYFDFVSNADSIYNAGIGTVRTSTGAFKTDDILDPNRINLEVYEDGTASVYCIPSGNIEKETGIITKTETKIKTIKEDTTIINEDTIFLKASVKSITIVKINGVEVSGFGYSDGSGVLYFSTPQTGYIEIEYIGYYHEAIPKYTLTPNGNLAVVEMYYLNQVLKHYWYIQSNDRYNLGGARVFIDDDPFIYRGYKTYMLDGGIPSEKVYANGTLFYSTRSYNTGTYTHKITPHLSPVDDASGNYEYWVDENATVKMITSMGKEITAVETIVDDKKYLTFDKYYPRVEITLSEPANIIETPKKTIDGEIIMTIENMNTHEVSEFEIGNVDRNDINSLPCELNQYVPIDMVRYAGVDLQAVAGVTFIVKNPQDDQSSIVCGEDGIIRLWVDMNGVYSIDISNLTGRTDNHILLTVSV